MRGLLEIIPNLVPPIGTLMLLLVTSSFAGRSRNGRALAWGLMAAFVVTCMAAVPAVMVSASNGFAGLGMAAMSTLVMAMSGCVFGLVAFLLALLVGWVSWKEPPVGERPTRLLEPLRRGAPLPERPSRD